MSTDTIDDLHAAEDAADVLAGALNDISSLVNSVTTEPGPLRDMTLAVFQRARTAVSMHAAYCRPSCQAHGEGRGECEDDDPECCGCPCHRNDP